MMELDTPEPVECSLCHDPIPSEEMPLAPDLGGDGKVHTDCFEEIAM